MSLSPVFTETGSFIFDVYLYYLERISQGQLLLDFCMYAITVNSQYLEVGS